MPTEAPWDADAGALLRAPGVAVLRMFGHHALSVHTKLFALLRHGALGVKLPAARAAALVAAGQAAPMAMGARRMKAWVEVAATAEPGLRRGLVAEAHAHVAGLAREAGAGRSRR